MNIGDPQMFHPVKICTMSCTVTVFTTIINARENIEEISKQFLCVRIIYQIYREQMFSTWWQYIVDKWYLCKLYIQLFKCIGPGILIVWVWKGISLFHTCTTPHRSTTWVINRLFSRKEVIWRIVSNSCMQSCVQYVVTLKREDIVLQCPERSVCGLG